MDLAAVIFWIIAAILVLAALAVVSLRNIVHSALALVLVFAMAAGIYVLLNAEFIAIVQILIYAGAVTILILFALMLTRIGGVQVTNPSNKPALRWAAVVICALVGASIIFAATFFPHANMGAHGDQVSGVNNVVAIGQLLYSNGAGNLPQYSYVLPFEIASLVLLVAIVGAIVIGREE
jgi:NADH:ubiquinone oxidoreductase subunit 6 (subunit J)